VHVAHRGLNVIVSRCVLQRERIRVVPPPRSERCGAAYAGPRRRAS
jgi:hypothetical protein